MDTKVMEQMLTEILEEQKQISDKLTSYTKVLMEVHDKLGNSKSTDSPADLEKLSERLRAVQLACKSITDQLNLPVKEIGELKQSLEGCTQQLKIPLTQLVVHHITKIWIVAAVLFVGIVILIFFLVKTKDRMQDYKANDLKYRHLKLSKNSSLQQLLMYSDSLYIVNPDSFSTNVKLLEAQNLRQLELLKQAVEKEREAKQLRDQAGQNQPAK